MKTKIFTLVLLLFAITSQVFSATKVPIPPTIVTVGTTGDYQTIAAAITGLGTITGPTFIELKSDYAQTKDIISAVAGASAVNTVTIRPQSALTVAGNDTIAGFVWKMDGCQYTIIDGRIGGVGEPALTLRADTCVGNSLSTLGHLRKVSALTVTNSNYINIQFVNFKGGTNESYRAAGPTTAPTMGVVTLAAGTNNLLLDNCNIGALDSIKGTPTVALISLGTSLLPNSNITISNNKIHDYYPVDMNKNTTYPSTGVGVQISDFNSNCVISGNSFYKTYAHSSNGVTNNNNARSSAIAVVNTSGTGFIVKDNYIGGSAPLCAGNPYTADIRNNTSFNAIYMSVGTGSLSAVYGNTIKNLMVLSHSQVAQTYQCSGIYINGGNINVGVKEDGTTASANIIGDMTTNASIKFCATNNNAAFSGIVYNSLASGNVKIANNKIGGVTVGFYAGYNTLRTGSFVGINILGTVASTIAIDNNQIGNNAIGADTTSMSIKNYLSRSNYGINVNPALPATTVLSITNNLSSG